MPLTKAGVSELLTLMQQFDRFVDVTELSVVAWHQLLEPEIDDDTVAREAMLAAYRNEQRVTAATIIEYAKDLALRATERLELERENAELRARALAAAGVTEEELEAHNSDRAWLEARFGAREVGS